MKPKSTTMWLTMTNDYTLAHVAGKVAAMFRRAYHRFAHGLAGDRAGVDGSAPKPRSAHHHSLSELCSLNCPMVTGGAGADYH
jgi:hypothetical protein